jgi:CheY-like chemotaxis protein
MPRAERVLLVDDDPDVLAIVSLALTAAPGYEVATAATAREALDQARSFRPDIILLDIMMPGTDGRGTLEALRADEETARIPVVFVTAGADRFDCPEYRALGALGVISKPFDPCLLPATLARLRKGEAVDESYPAPLAALAATYEESLRETLGSMEELAAGVARGGWQRPIVESLRALAHRLEGTAGLYAQSRTSATAGRLAGMLKRILDDDRWPPTRPPGDIVRLVQAVARTAPRRPRRAAPSHRR